MISTTLDNDALLHITYPPRWYPKNFTLENARLAFANVPMIRYMRNSRVVAVGNILFSLFGAITCGYALSKILFKGRVSF